MKFKPLALIIITFFVYGFSEELPETVKPELVYDSSSVETDKIIRIGVLFKIKPHWHIYWKNSGDSGLPTKLDFTLPEGFEAEGINWPLPNSYERSGGILDYGYEDEVLLWSDIKVPDDYKAGSKIPLKVLSKWVSCEEICIPGKEEFTADIVPGTNNKTLFEKWIRKLPSDKNKDINLTVKNKRIDDDSYNFIITIIHSDLESNFKLFPNPRKSLDIASISYENPDNKSSVINFTVTLYPGHTSEPEDIDMLITYKDINGEIKGFNYPIKLLIIQ